MAPKLQKKDVPIYLTTTESALLPKTFGLPGMLNKHQKGGLALAFPTMVEIIREELGYRNTHVFLPALDNITKENEETAIYDKRAFEDRLHVEESHIHLVKDTHIRGLKHITTELKKIIFRIE